MSKPMCNNRDFQQAKKWVWYKDRLDKGGYWLCWGCFHNAVAAGEIEKSGNNYSDV